MPLFSLSGTRPSNLGVRDGKLAPCPASPNCVCSQAEDAGHRIEPLRYSGDPEGAIAQVKTMIEAMAGTQVIEATGDYLYAEFTTPLMGYVDDVEFYLDRAAQVLQVRSASRLGKSDLGVNRKRVEAIRAQLMAN
jgi:uncharacterized protein (DUF1499 family)